MVLSLWAGRCWAKLQFLKAQHDVSVPLMSVTWVLFNGRRLFSVGRWSLCAGFTRRRPLSCFHSRSLLHNPGKGGQPARWAGYSRSRLEDRCPACVWPSCPPFGFTCRPAGLNCYLWSPRSTIHPEGSDPLVSSWLQCSKCKLVSGVGIETGSTHGSRSVTVSHGFPETSQKFPDGHFSFKLIKTNKY